MRTYNLDVDDIYILKNICAYWQLYESAAKYRDMEKKRSFTRPIGSENNDDDIEYTIDRDVVLNEIKSIISEYSGSYKKIIDFIVDKYSHKGKEKTIDMLTELLHIGINNNIKYSKEILLSKMRTIKINSLLYE